MLPRKLFHPSSSLRSWGRGKIFPIHSALGLKSNRSGKHASYQGALDSSLGGSKSFLLSGFWGLHLEPERTVKERTLSHTSLVTLLPSRLSPWSFQGSSGWFWDEALAALYPIMLEQWHQVSVRGKSGLLTSIRLDSSQFDCYVIHIPYSSPIKVCVIQWLLVNSELWSHHRKQYFISTFSLLQKGTSHPLLITLQYPHPSQISSAQV